jgi:hypothetical protein
MKANTKRVTNSTIKGTSLLYICQFSAITTGFMGATRYTYLKAERGGGGAFGVRPQDMIGRCR